MTNKGHLIIMSGPSGVGKDTMFRHLSQNGCAVKRAITATTRQKRHYECDGVDYYYKSKEEFERLISEGDLLEYNYYNENYYGTLRSTVQSSVDEGYNLVLIIDINGAKAIKEKFPEAFMVFIKPPSIEKLIERLIARGTETSESLQRRIEQAEVEMREMDNYDFVIENDDLDIAVQQLKDKIESLE